MKGKNIDNYTASDMMEKMSVLKEEGHLLLHKMWGYLMMYAHFRKALIYFSCILISQCHLKVTTYLVPLR